MMAHDRHGIRPVGYNGKNFFIHLLVYMLYFRLITWLLSKSRFGLLTQTLSSSYL
jgi:hypothetical protein